VAESAHGKLGAEEKMRRLRRVRKMEEKEQVYLADRRMSELVFSGTKEEVRRKILTFYHLGF